MKLKNGCEVIATLPEARGSRVFVAADRGEGYQRWIVWELDVMTGETYSGDYYTTKIHAIAGLIERAGWAKPSALDAIRGRAV